MKTYWKLSSDRQSTQVEKILRLTLETPCGSWPSCSGPPGHLRSLTTNVRDCTLLARSSIRRLTNYTCQRWCGTTTFSTCHNSIGIHHQAQASHWTNLTRWLFMTRKNGKSITHSTQNGVVRSCIISFNGLHKDMSVWVGSKQKSSGMLRSWWTNAITATQGISDSGGKKSNWHCFLFSFFVIGSGPVQMALAWVLPPANHSQVEVEFPCTPYPQDDHGICFLFVPMFVFLFVYRYAAQEVCG